MNDSFEVHKISRSAAHPRDAIRRNALSVGYQQQFDPCTGRVAGDCHDD
jgi:hypothetical protein